MATQGMVTVCQNGKVVMKIVVGMDGYNAGLVADVLRASGKVPTKRQAYRLANQMGFGHRDNLVVIDTTSELYLGSEPVGPRYRKTFDDPNFNPRWEFGTVDHLEIVNL